MTMVARLARRSAILLTATLAACGRAPETPRDPVPPVAVSQPDGTMFDLVQERGAVVLIAFGYTHCPDVCPTTLADFASVHRRLGPRAEGVRLVFISVDPDRDTPEGVRDYARAFDPGIVGLAPDSATLAPIMRGFGVAAFKEPGEVPGVYTVAHTATVFVVDREGRVADRVGFAQTRADELVRAIEPLLEQP